MTHLKRRRLQVVVGRGVRGVLALCAGRCGPGPGGGRLGARGGMRLHLREGLVRRLRCACRQAGMQASRHGRKGCLATTPC